MPDQDLTTFIFGQVSGQVMSLSVILSLTILRQLYGRRGECLKCSFMTEMERQVLGF